MDQNLSIGAASEQISALGACDIHEPFRAQSRGVLASALIAVKRPVAVFIAADDGLNKPSYGGA